MHKPCEFRSAQALTGDNLSATIVRALRRLVEIEEGRALVGVSVDG
jgi:hypothetical protein